MIIELNGGLGNQLFIYSFALHIAKESNSLVLSNVLFNRQNRSNKLSELGLEAFDYEKWPRVKLVYYKYLKRSKFILQNERSYSPVTYYGGYYRGYWQWPGLIDKSLKAKINLASEKYIFKTDIKDLTNTVAIHMRFTDYVESAIHASCSMNYYKNGLNELSKTQKFNRLLVVSDDQNMARQAVLDWAGFEIIFSREESDIGDFFLLTKCKFHVISNSTFAWWAAFCAQSGGKTIIPRYWWSNDEYNPFAIKGFKIIEN